MAVETSTGLSVEISTATPATFDKAGFDALTYTPIGEITSVTEYGQSQEEVNHTPLSDGIVQKLKGALNYGTFGMEFGYDPSDAGQAILEAGAGGAENFTQHSVKVTYSSGRIDYIYGYVFGYNKNPGAINSVVSGNSSIGINKPIVDGT